MRVYLRLSALNCSDALTSIGAFSAGAAALELLPSSSKTSRLSTNRATGRDTGDGVTRSSVVVLGATVRFIGNSDAALAAFAF